MRSRVCCVASIFHQRPRLLKIFLQCRSQHVGFLSLGWRAWCGCLNSQHHALHTHPQERKKCSGLAGYLCASRSKILPRHPSGILPVLTARSVSHIHQAPQRERGDCSVRLRPVIIHLLGLKEGPYFFEMLLPKQCEALQTKEEAGNATGKGKMCATL